MFRVVSLFFWRIRMVCLALELAGSWVELGFSVDMENFGWALVYYCFLGSGVLWYSQVLELSLLPLGFGPPITVASRLPHSYSTEDKTSKLIMNHPTTARNTQRDSQSYIEKCRGSREIEVTRRKKERIKSGDNSQASDQIPKWKWILKIRFLKVQNW